MQISFSPVRGDAPLELSVTGEVLTVNGLTLDLSVIPDGATLPQAAVACDLLASDIERVAGQLQLKLLLPHGPEAPEATRWPAPITISSDGPVNLPPFGAAEETPAPEEAPE